MYSLLESEQDVGQREMDGINLNTFKNYKKTIFDLTGDLKKLREFAQKLNLDTAIALINHLLDKINLNSFKVGVFGEFKRGKSTFINALIGKEILPTDILPTTATLNRITYGVKPSVKISFKDGREEEVPLEQLSEYVTKLTPEAEETAANVQEATVYYPVNYCQNNVDIIDTPGLNDEAKMDEVTHSVLSEVDVAIMVIMAQSPFSQSEQEFLENKLLDSNLSRILFVVTGIDRYNVPDEIEKGITYIKHCLKKILGKQIKEVYSEDSSEYQTYFQKIESLQVFGLSAYQALQAKQTGDAQLMNASRFGEFETTLEKLLVEERGVAFMEVLANQTIVSAMEVLTAINRQSASFINQKKEIEATYETAVAKLIAQQAKAKAEQKIEAVLEAQGVLVEVRGKLERVKTLIELQLQSFEEMGNQTQSILANAQALYEHLMESEVDYYLPRSASQLSLIRKNSQSKIIKVEEEFSPIKPITIALEEPSPKTVESYAILKLLFTVARDGSGQFTSINEAIQNAPSGSQIRVLPGVYNETLMIDKPLEIVGEGATRDIIVENSNANCIVMQCDRATVRNLTICHRAGLDGKAYHAVDIPQGQLILEDCDISSDSMACIAIYSHIADPIIRRCKIHDGKQGGILFYQGGKGLIEDCDIYNHPYLAIAIRTLANPIIRRCQIHDGKQGGIFSWGRGLGTVEDCDIYNNQGGNIKISPDSNTTLLHCRVR